MSVDLASPQSLPCPKASNSRESSPVPEIYGPEEHYASLQMSSAETSHVETAVSSLPSSMDLLIQNSPGSSTSPSVILPTSVENTMMEEGKVQVKKKIRTVFSKAQLGILNERFQRQKYLSLQEIEELSTILNLSYKQVKTWFQNQRMKYKRWQKYNWPKNSIGMTRKGSATAEYPGLSSCHQGCLVNASGNFSVWSNQTCNNPTWNNYSWNNQSWSYHSWNSQTWCPPEWNNQSWNNQAWNNELYSGGEEALLPQIQFQQDQPISDLEVALETAGESYEVIQETPTYFSTQQIMDLFPNYSMNIQPDDM